MVCPETELNTPLFSDVTRRTLLDGVLVDASVLETRISGIPLRDDSDSEIELEQLESDTDSEVAELRYVMLPPILIICNYLTTEIWFRSFI